MNKFKGLDNITPCKLYLVWVSKHFSVNETKEIVPNGTVHDFSIKCNYTLHLHDYLLKKYKWYLRLFNWYLLWYRVLEDHKIHKIWNSYL